MDDLISRQAVIYALNKRARITFSIMPGYEFYLGALHDAADDIKTLPSVQPEQGWIPCSERLPEEWGDYLVTKKEIGWNCEEYQVNDIAYYDRDGFHKANTVLAWMPLPEPYKEGERMTDLIREVGDKP